MLRARRPVPLPAGPRETFPYFPGGPSTLVGFGLDLLFFLIFI